jgi:polyisoprenyl-phosphate glycosyltransferase
MKISIVVPCFNEEEVISTTHKRIKEVLQSVDNSYEIIYINDGSEDGTLSNLRNIANQDTNVRVLSFSRNFGHQAAVAAGINNSEGDCCLIIDADLQDPPELLPDMLKQMQASECNVVYGVRKMRKGETWFKRISAKFFYKLINSLSDVKLPLDTGDFRLIDRKVMNAFNDLPETHKYIRGLIAWLGFKQEPFFYVREKRFAGETHYPLFKMVSFALKGLFYFSNRPLKIASNLGFFCTAIGLSLFLYVIISYLFQFEKLVSGWASILITVVFFGGVQLLTIGILGEYLGNIFDEVKKRPHYLISEKINF